MLLKWLRCFLSGEFLSARVDPIHDCVVIRLGRLSSSLSLTTRIKIVNVM